MRTTNPTPVTTLEPSFKMPSERRTAEVATGVTDRDLALIHGQVKFCAICHGILSSSPNDTNYDDDGDVSPIDVSPEDMTVRDGDGCIGIDIDIETISDLDDVTARDGPLDAIVADMASVCGSCRQRVRDSIASTAQGMDGVVRGSQFAHSRAPMAVDLETAIPSPPRPLVEAPASTIPEIPERDQTVANCLPRTRPTVSIPPTRRDTHSPHASPSTSETQTYPRKSSPLQLNSIRSVSVGRTSPVSIQPVPRHDEYPDPMVDITRLRVRSNGYKCLYPGATFQGTQKSGRNSYDVNVTIVNVDFAASFLCGYLRIRGLTDDWPELTTYFDAQIIGNRYGFLTQDWGASENDDTTHWGRFAPFQQIKNSSSNPLEGPQWTLEDNKRYGAVFMRWKERFLVPDHRVQDINGASFAGFYYICVDFAPQKRSHRGSTQESSQSSEDYEEPPCENSCDEPEPTMCGYYFHQNSEPYQQLSLTHVPERIVSTFEFR